MRFNYHKIWNKKILQDICVFFKGNGISKEDLSDDGNPCILYGQLYTTYKNEIINEVISRTNVDLKNPFYSKKNDLIIPSSGEDPLDIAVARSIKQENVLLGGDLNILRLNKEVSSDFLSYQLNGVRKYDIARIAQGKSIVHLHNDDLKNIKVFVPPIEEQKKIAHFLSLLDLRIEAQIKIIEDKKIVMNNLMYRLFNDCNQFSTLSHFIKFGKAGGTPKSTNSSYYNGDIPFLSISDISNQGKYINYTNKTITQDGLDNSSAWIVPSNSLILSMYASVGYPAINSIPLATSQAMFAMVLNDQSDLDFLYYFLLFFQKHKLNNLLETGTQSNINADTVKSIKVPIFEANTKEQIVNLLNALYKSIENEKDILNKYITQKEYLLSNLFI